MLLANDTECHNGVNFPIQSPYNAKCSKTLIFREFKRYPLSLLLLLLWLLLLFVSKIYLNFKKTENSLFQHIINFQCTWLG